MTARYFVLSLKYKKLFYITKDNAYLCHDCAEQNQTLIVDAINENNNTGGWLVILTDNDTDSDGTIQCAHCYKEIESTY